MHQGLIQIRYIFKSIGKDYLQPLKQYPTPQQLTTLVETERVKLQKQGQLKSIKGFVKKQSHPHSQYIKLTNKQFLQLYLQRMNNPIIVQFFFTTKKQSISMQLNKMGNDMEQRERELKLMVNELKDEANQFYAMQIINKLSSSRSSIQIEHVVDIYLVVSDPLVSIDGPQMQPIYHDEVNITSHMDRWKRASTSYSNLTIKAKIYWATRSNYVSILNEECNAGKKIKIVQLLTEVRRINNKLMISFQGKLGERIWQPAEEILSYQKIDLLIVVGIGAYMLEQIDYPKPLILITSISLQDKRTITQYRNVLDSYNAYNDTFSQTFLQNFYQNLFKRIEIGQSVELAKKQSSKFIEKYIWCCCMHQHAQGCSWQKIVDKIGHMQAHRLFKHTFEDYKKDNFYPCTYEIQQFLLGNGETCGTGSICCFDKMGESKVGLHKQVNKILFWNKQCSQVLYDALDVDQGKLNKFQCQEYEKPTGRKNPLSIYKLLQSLTKQQQEAVLILKSRSVTTAKRYLNWAKEYLQARDKSSFFCQLFIANQSEAKDFLKEVLTKLKSKAKLGSNTNIKIKFFLQITHNTQKTDKYYYRLFKDYSNQLLSQAKVLGLSMQKLKIILLTSNPNFDVLYPLFKMQECQESELYYDIFSKYTYDYIRANLDTIKNQIKRQELVKEDIEDICDEMLFQRFNQYIFLGFISLFSEDGFYLTKYGRIITQNLFGKEMLQKIANHTLPVEMISLSDCIYLQLNKNYLSHFTGIENSYKGEFQKKQLQYYYLLFRTYQELVLQTSEGMRGVKKEGLFAIDILLEDATYNSKVEICKASIKQAGGPHHLFQNNHFWHIYHFNQTEKLIQNYTRRKKNQYVATSKSFVRQVEPFICTYLFWSVIHIGWKIASSISHQFLEKVNHFQCVILIFLIRVEVITPFAQIARLQLYSMIEKIPPKSQQPIKCSKEMGKLLIFLRTYSTQQYNLSQMELSWGQTVKLKELICNCTNIAERIIDLLQKENSELGEELLQHKMFANFTIIEWQRQILKLTQKKIIYYFELTKMLKNMQSKSSWKQKQKQFNNQFKLLEIVKQFRAILSKLPQSQRELKHRILIDHYLKILLDQEEVSSAIIMDVKGKLSPQYLPLFDHLCQKIQQKTLFNQRGLIICARLRTLLSEGKPYIMNRKRNLTMFYLKESLLKMSVKISYFTLTSNTLNNLKSNESNNKCSMLFLILTVDALTQRQLLFGQDNSINSELMDINKFASQIKQCRISVLIICGKNSIKICEKLLQLIKDAEHVPNIIAIQNNKYDLCDEPYNNYKTEMSEKTWEYICNEVSQISFDLLAIAIIANINNKLIYRAWTFTSEDLEERVRKSLKMVYSILAKYFECTDQVLSMVSFKIWANHKKIDRVSNGTLQDLTAKFYSSDHNLHDQNFYENIGRCSQVNKIIEAIVKQAQRCIQIIGSSNTGKSTLLQEVCWICQTKSFFKFGVFKFNLAEDKDTSIMSFEEFVKGRQFKNCQNFKTTQTSVLIALDNVDEQFLQAHKSILWNLKAKSVTIIFTTKKAQNGSALKAILDCKGNLSINLNTISMNEVYGVLMAHIRAYKWSENHRFSKEMVREFQKKIGNIMKIIELTDDENKLNRALELIRDISSKKEEERTFLSLEFYRKNFEGLVKLIQNVKEIKLTIV